MINVQKREEQIKRLKRIISEKEKGGNPDPKELRKLKKMLKRAQRRIRAFKQAETPSKESEK